MMAAHYNASFTLMAATQADLTLAGRVARSLRKQSCAVELREQALGRDSLGCDALISHTSAERLGRLFDELGLQTAGQGRGMVLIHPEPEAAHYALALRRGLGDVIAWPGELDSWCRQHSQRHGTEAAGNSALLGQSIAMRQLRQRVQRIAAYDSTVLLSGETGTGKECVANAIHAASPRRGQPMISINCAALPDLLVESELFGYERGAFTGAHSSQAGKFAAAEGGTLFLDEIGDMPLCAQAKILRVIENQEYFRLGSTRAQHSNVRLIAATHQPLDELCRQGRFRLDLYYRLNVAPIELPSLRERAEDIGLLAEQFLRESCQRIGRPLKLGAEASQALLDYHWPGNVRELRNAIELAAINCERQQIGLSDLPPQLMRWASSRPQAQDELSQLSSLLIDTQWNKSEVARTLNWSRMKLYRKLKFYGLDTPKR
jgi:DNA-binding NtrC family response regulator